MLKHPKIPVVVYRVKILVTFSDGIHHRRAPMLIQKPLQRQEATMWIVFRILAFLLLLLLFFVFLICRVIPCILCDLFELHKPVFDLADTTPRLASIHISKNINIWHDQRKVSARGQVLCSHLSFTHNESQPLIHTAQGMFRNTL